MTIPLHPLALHVVRTPGEAGPILRCFGELSVRTAEVLRRELAVLLPMRHRALTLNVSGCASVDVDGILTILHTWKDLRQKGSLLLLVVGRGRTAQLLDFTGIGRILPLFPDEESAAQALRGGGDALPGPATWEEARAETVTCWRTILGLLDQSAPEDVLRQMTTMTALCERSEKLYQERSTPAAVRCQFCPLFYELGGQPEDVGCRSVIDPIIQALREGDRHTARVQVAEILRILEEMTLPQGDGTAPVPWLPAAPADRSEE